MKLSSRGGEKGRALLRKVHTLAGARPRVYSFSANEHASILHFTRPAGRTLDDGHARRHVEVVDRFACRFVGAEKQLTGEVKHFDRLFRRRLHMQPASTAPNGDSTRNSEVADVVRHCDGASSLQTAVVRGGRDGGRSGLERRDESEVIDRGHACVRR